MDKLGSVIIPSDEVTKVGGLYIGGYRPSINRQFLQSQHITHILNAAAGLVNFFGPKYEVRNYGYLKFTRRNSTFRAKAFRRLLYNFPSKGLRSKRRIGNSSYRLNEEKKKKNNNKIHYHS
jgi:hypothetical protein